MGDQPSDQGLALLFAKVVLERLDDLQPLRKVIFRLDRLLDAVGFGAARVRLDHWTARAALTLRRRNAVMQSASRTRFAVFLSSCFITSKRAPASTQWKATASAWMSVDPRGQLR